MNFICITCGTQFTASSQPPARCPICEDERQYIGLDGQQWTTLDELRQDHHNEIRHEEPNLSSVWTVPKFAIGQRAFVLQTNNGNVLWDCITLLDKAVMEYIAEIGGIKAIAISHPHYYTTMAEWSAAFGNAPIYLHEADREWVMRPDNSIVYWTGETRTLFGGITLIRGGGHFEGGAMLHWPAGAEGKGALLSGDIIQVVPDRRWVSFMYSYPNYIPLSAAAVERVVSAVEPFEFDRIYGAFGGMTVSTGGKRAVRRSADRYIRHLAEND
jgi:glyoxylase-like metal-dependent hydrolase (beta-lactamase superfamily II)